MTLNHSAGNYSGDKCLTHTRQLKKTRNRQKISLIDAPECSQLDQVFHFAKEGNIAVLIYIARYTP